MVYVICTVLICATYILSHCLRIDANAKEKAQFRKHEMELYRNNSGEGLPSPYILKREWGKRNGWGYSIFDTRINQFVSSSGYYEIFPDIVKAVIVLNNLEATEGFSKTVI